MQITATRFTSSLLRPQSRKEFFEASNLAFHSNNQWCWCSSSAAVCSDSFTPQQGRKKLTKQERSVLVLAFVDKYMASNGGKFPTITCTRKQVGGSHYIIRSIIQELEYHHKRASFGTKIEFKISEKNDKSKVFSLKAEPCILTDANHKTASSESKKEVKIKEEHDKCEVFPFTSDTDQKTTSLEVKMEVKIREEIDKCEDFPSTVEPCILVDTEQASFKEHVEGGTKIRKKHLINNSKIDTKTSQSSIEAHSDDQIDINTHKQLSPSKISKDIQEDEYLGFDNMHSSTPSAMTTVKQQTHTSSGVSVNAENPVSAEFKTKKFTLRTASEEGEFLEKDGASAANLQGEYCPEEKKTSNQEELYHGRQESTEHGTAAATNGSSFWGSLKSMAFGIINLWKK
ncbi:hypothetical protein KSP39_PZI009749 [Platanthera zijinensis]|uniref:AT3G52170-like helix-turn-helix domain-containing protein n=1 Tax=Platanthera zijinensis TaxID=2320716 RepID=A0AAP0BLY9_9ASPA